jgi:hypothetical protein
MHFAARWQAAALNRTCTFLENAWSSQHRNAPLKDTEEFVLSAILYSDRMKGYVVEG